jgi:hypothetical protein
MVSEPLPSHVEELLEECRRLRERATVAIERSVTIQDEIRQFHDWLEEQVWRKMRTEPLRKLADPSSRARRETSP